MRRVLKDHWREYAIEAWCLATFMGSACVFGVVIFHPASPVAVVGWAVRNVFMGVVMGATAVAIICSPWGKRSGAHFNPAVTLTFLRLRKIARLDAAFYILAHFVGGVAGVSISWVFLGDLLADSMVNFVATVPGKYGIGTAFIAELVISFLMMSMILWTSNSVKLSRLTPYLAGIFVAFYISVEAPVSGMSMNPARSLASAAFAGTWASVWIYFLAPPIAMLAAAEVFVRIRGVRAVLCAKLNHNNRLTCIFNCGWGENHRGATQNTAFSERAVFTDAV